ncbi:MAG TPA: hypothetical protein VGP72_07435 [Planctomycetota bacterium]|jgi:hypothetical protein
MSEIPKVWRVIGMLLGAISVLGGVALAIIILRESTKPAGAPSASRPYNYDMESLRRIDPAMLQYDQEQKIATGFKKAGGLAVSSDDTIWVAGDGALRAYDASGSRKSEIKLTGDARCVAVDSTAIYAGLNDHVEVYDTAGARTANWPSIGKEARITAIAVSGEDVFVADSGGRVVLRCDKTGKVLAKIGQRDDAKKEVGIVLPSPYLDVSVGSDGYVYVNNPGRHRIEAYTPDGELARFVGQPSMGVDGFCGCCNPVALCVRPGGGFVTSEKGIARVKLLDAAGKLECLVAAPDSFGEMAFAQSIALDPKGRVYLLDNSNCVVRVFARKAKKDGG